MSSFIDRLDNKLKIVLEGETDYYKSQNFAEYDRQYAEDLLYHTIGPLTDSPRWAEQWTSPSDPPDDFVPGGPAPKWTEEELVYAFSGDPQYLFQLGAKDNPRSPSYGFMGGSPLYRAARKVARIYNRASDKSFISDLYSNGFVALLRMMQSGKDKSMSAFIKFAIRNVLGAMEHGIGGEKRTLAAAGFENELGQKGLKGILDETDPKKIRQAAEIVKGEYRTHSSHDQHEDNPFGMFSADYYNNVMDYADAIESQDEARIAQSRNYIKDLISEIDKYNLMIGGASTGLGQAVDTPDRKTSVGVVSVDAPMGNDDDSAGMVGNLQGTDPRTVPLETAESVEFVLDIAMKYDLADVLANSEKYQAMAIELGIKKDKAGRPKIGGKLSANELRSIIRTLGPYGKNYPGKGKVRENLEVPRDSRKIKNKEWWKPGEDPEIEPIPKAPEAEGMEGVQENEEKDKGPKLWRSAWSREGYRVMEPSEIKNEFTQEVKEFAELGIPTAREIKTKKKGNQVVEEAVSRMYIAAMLKSATVKMQIIADIYSDSVSQDQAKLENKHIPGGLMLEELDSVDRTIISETALMISKKISESLENDGKYSRTDIRSWHNKMPPVEVLANRKIMREVQ